MSAGTETVPAVGPELIYGAAAFFAAPFKAAVAYCDHKPSVIGVAAASRNAAKLIVGQLARFVNFLKIRLSALLVKRVIVLFRESQKLLGRVCLLCLFQKLSVFHNGSLTSCSRT